MRLLLIIITSLVFQYFVLAQNPTLLGFITDNPTTLMESASDIAIQGNYAYISSNGEEKGIEVIDISDPSNPSHAGSLEAPGTGSSGPNSIVVFDNYAYSIDKDGKLWIIDISNPSNPSTAQRLRLQNSSNLGVDIYISILSQYNGDLIIYTLMNTFKFDISNPLIPVQVDDVYDEFFASQIFMQGDLLVGLDQSTIIQLDLTTFQYKTDINLPGDNYISVLVRGDKVYSFLNPSEGSVLRIYDISDPSDPSIITERIYDIANKMTISGNYLYAANSNKIQIFNIANPLDISLSGSLDLSLSSVTKVVAIGDHIYVLSKKSFNSGQGALRILDISGTPADGTTGGGNPPSTPDAGVIVFDDLVQIKDYVMPSSDGVNGQVIKTNGSGALSWTTVTSGDPSSSNEIQTLSQNGSTISLSLGGGSASINDSDASATNEIQTLSKSGNTLLLSNGGGSASLSSYLDNTDDWDNAGNDVIFYAGDAVGIGTDDPQAMFQVGEPSNPGVGLSSKWETYSDVRLKKDLLPITSPIEIVQQLNGRYFNWKSTDEQDIGFIAQEVEEVLPIVVSTHADGYKSMDYSRIVPLLVEAIKDQQTEIENLRARIEKMEKK